MKSIRPELIYGPAGSGKTQWTTEKCASLLGDQSPVTVLLPSQPLIADFKERLFHGSDIKGGLNVEFHTFYSLIKQYAHLTGVMHRELHEHHLHFLLSGFLEHRRADYPELLKHNLTPGFTTALLRYFQDLEDGALGVTTIQELVDNPELRSHSLRLTEIQQLYIDFIDYLLDRKCISREQLFIKTWKSLERGEVQSISERAFLIDGFYDFTPIQRGIVEAITEQAPYTAITLLDGENKIFDYVTSTSQWLKKKVLAHEGTIIPLENTSGPLPDIEQLFEKPSAGELPPNYQSIEATGIGLEIQEVTRQVKQDILSGAYSADEIAVLFRNEADYYTRLSARFQKESIPLDADLELPLGTNPAINALFQWYDVLQSNYARPDIIRWLQPDYIAPSQLNTEYSIARLDRISRVANILEGIKDWKSGLNRVVEKSDNDEKIPSTSVLSERDREIANRFLELLEQLPVAKTASWQQHIRDLQRVIDVTNFARTLPKSNLDLQTGIDDELIARDARAYRRLQELLDSFGELSDEFKFQELTTTQFVSELQDLLYKTVYKVVANSSTGVTVGTVENARGQFWKKVYLVGMVDGVFPVQWRAHPLVKVEDRIRINRLLESPKKIVEHRADLPEEQLLFYIAVTRATESLRMSTITGSEEILPSIFYEEFNRFYSPDQKPAENDSGGFVRQIMPKRLEFSSENSWLQLDLLLHLTEVKDFDDGLFPFSATSYRHLQKVFEQREGSEFTIYDGHLVSDEIRDAITESLLGGKPMSAGRLETYYTSPFRYFAEYILGLAEVEEVPEELPPQDRGKLLHTILEQFYSRFSADYSGILNDENHETVETLLDEIISREFETYRQQPIPVPELLWEREADLLREYIHNAVRFFVSKYPWSDTKLRPDKFEMAFGMDIDDSYPPLKIEHNGETISFRGMIDRLDINRETGEYTVVDYKTTRGKSRQDFYNGKAMQLQVYAMAAEQILPEYDVPVRLSYYSLRHNKEDGILSLNPDEKSQLFSNTSNFIWQAIRQMTSGVFHPVEGECDSYCPVKDICGCDEHRIRMKT